TIRFKAPKIMFLQGSDKLKTRFKKILKNFCPRYISVLRSNFKPGEIHEVRIIGHSSSEWGTKKRRKIYISNADLSLNRSFNVHKFCYDNLPRKSQKAWFSQRAVTIGANYVHKIKKQGKEIKSLSRRVEFRAQLKILSDLREEFIKIR
ncbi:MAG: OmpA family protein, partial [Halobacteriovoraceae bacterium]|nr:OmpA family protein [Halobacteriovoraceae bacterium]